MMKVKNNNLIQKTLVIIAIFVFTLMASTPANAYYDGYSYESSAVFYNNNVITPAYNPPTVQSNNSATNTETTTDKTNSADEDTSNLAGNALSAVSSGLIGWIIVAALILIVVMIFRKFYAEDEYKNKPLKHA